MAYFKNIPLIYYEYVANGQNVMTTLKDLTYNMRFNKELVESVQMSDSYVIADGETPELVSLKFYGTMEYHWLIMVLNSKFDIQEDWPMNSGALEDHIKEKYGFANINNVHHYLDKDGFELFETQPYIDIYELNRTTDLVGKWKITGTNVSDSTYVVSAGTSNELTMNNVAILPGEFQAKFIRYVDPMRATTAVTNYEYEVKLNDAKRTIKIIHPQLMTQVLAMVDTMFSESNNA